MATTKRAAKGGEIGANGEFYEGGKFINTIPENAKKEGGKPRKPRKVEIEPYKWVVAEAGKASIYSQLAGVFGKVVNGIMVIRTDDRMPQTLAYMRETLESVESLAARYNAGERWV